VLAHVAGIPYSLRGILYTTFPRSEHLGAVLSPLGEDTSSGAQGTSSDMTSRLESFDRTDRDQKARVWQASLLRMAATLIVIIIPRPFPAAFDMFGPRGRECGTGTRGWRGGSSTLHLPLNK